MRLRKVQPLSLALALGLLLVGQATAGTITLGKNVALVPNEPAPNLLYRTIGYTAFVPMDSSVGYARSASPDGRYATSAGPDTTGTLSATIDLPSGALIQTIEFNFCSNAAASVGISLQVQIDDKSGATGGATPIMGVVGTVGCLDLTANVSGFNWAIDNNSNRVMLQAASTAFDGSVSFSGVVVGYVLQVSPAPAVPTFNDVPTSDPGFQYIEALAASGITAGCGGGNYCPDSTITRRQMAIFLAKALGLYFH